MVGVTAGVTTTVGAADAAAAAKRDRAHMAHAGDAFALKNVHTPHGHCGASSAEVDTKAGSDDTALSLGGTASTGAGGGTYATGTGFAFTWCA